MGSSDYRVILVSLYHGSCHGSGGVHKVHIVSSSLSARRYVSDAIRVETSKSLSISGVHGFELVAIEDRSLRASLGHGVSGIGVNVSCPDCCGVR